MLLDVVLQYTPFVSVNIGVFARYECMNIGVFTAIAVISPVQIKKFCYGFVKCFLKACFQTF